MRKKITVFFLLCILDVFVIFFSGCASTGSNAIEIDPETGEIIKE